MEMTIDDIKHCLKVMVDCEVCEECNLYGTTGTDHCEHDCVYGALDIIDKYQKIADLYDNWRSDKCEYTISCMENIGKVLRDGNDDCR